MTAQTPAERKAAERQRRKKDGLVRVEMYCHLGDVAAIKALAAKLAKKRVNTYLAKAPIADD